MSDLDPAMIERAAEAIAEVFMRLFAGGGPPSPRARTAAAEMAEAAAAVIVPATAEAIAAAIEATQVNNAPQFAAIARSFAAGLSAGATTGGDSDVATSIWPLLPSSAGGTDPIGGDGDGQQ